ncbi:MAG TPA: hypothetical protein VM782_17575, partial [Stellaceae bacterium]|nr:hypothetical protein [Stellaceae bacterium]
YRYLLERAWRPLFDTVYWVVFVLFAAPGLYSAIFIAQHQFGWLRRYQFGVNPLLACAVNVLGFFGGNAVGVGHAWILLPAIVLTAVAVVSEIDRCHLANPIHLCLLMLVAMLPVALVGFSESRSFLYLAAVWTLVLTAFVDRTLKRGFDSRGVLLGSCAILPGIAAIGDLGDGAHPFKRTTAIPFDEVIDFVERNEHGDSVVISTNRVASWVLHADAIVSRRCVFILPGPQPGCFAEGRHEQSIFVISERVGHFQYNPYENKGVIRRIAEITQGREKIAELHVGRDEDAMLKTRLTGVPLDEFILTVDFYR